MKTRTGTSKYHLGDKIGTCTVVGIRKVHKGRRVLDVERRDGPHRLFTYSLWPSDIGKRKLDFLSLEFTLPLEIVHPCWLIATGGPERVEALRSPLVHDTARMYQPVRQYIAEHGLVLTAQETFEDFDFMGGKVEMSVYVPPAARNGMLAGTELSLPWFASAVLLTEEHD